MLDELEKIVSEIGKGNQKLTKWLEKHKEDESLATQEGLRLVSDICEMERKHAHIYFDIAAIIVKQGLNT